MNFNSFITTSLLRSNGKVPINKLGNCGQIYKTSLRKYNFSPILKQSKINSQIFDRSVRLEFDENNVKKFGFKWLRDHCRCECCLYPISRQRIFDTKRVKNIEPPKNVNINDEELTIEWSDGHKTSFKTEWLSKIANENPSKSPYEPLLHPTFWNTSYFNSLPLPYVHYDEIMEENGKNEGLKKWLKLIAEFGFSIVKGVPPNVQNTHQLIRKISFPRQNVYGEFWHLKWADNQKEKEHSDTAYSNFPLSPHTDCTYFIDSPGLQFFQIPVHTGNGGENTVVDSFRVIETLKNKYPSAYDYFLKTPFPFHMYENGSQYQTFDYILKFDLYSGKLIQFRYNNDDRSPVFIPQEKEDEHYDAIIKLLELSQSEENILNLKLNPDELLVTNNWRVMHGRKSFDGYRELVGAYITMEEFLMRYRSLSD